MWSFLKQFFVSFGKTKLLVNLGKNINETVVNALNSVDNKLYSSCLQSYIVNIGETNFGGHYVIWKQKSDTLGWIKISSHPTKSYANLVKNFQNVYLLFLERFKVV